MAQSSILLESGTNEVEFAEFTVGDEQLRDQCRQDPPDYFIQQR